MKPEYGNYYTVVSSRKGYFNDMNDINTIDNVKYTKKLKVFRNSEIANLDF